MKNLTYILIILSVACSKDDMFEDTYQIPAPSVEVPVQEAAQTPVAETTQAPTVDVAAPVVNCGPNAVAFVEGQNYENIAYDIHYNTAIEGVRLEGVLEAIVLIEDLDFIPLTDKLQNTAQVFELGHVMEHQGAQGYAMREHTCSVAHAKYHERMLNNDNQSLDFFAGAQSEIVSRLMIHELAHVVHFDFENETFEEVQNMFNAAKDMYPGEVEAQEYWTVNEHEFLAEIITALGTGERFTQAFGYEHPAKKLYDNNEDIRNFIDANFIN